MFWTDDDGEREGTRRERNAPRESLKRKRRRARQKAIYNRRILGFYTYLGFSLLISPIYKRRERIENGATEERHMMRASPSSLDGWSGHRTTTRTTKAAAPTRRSRRFTERQHHRRGVVRSGTFSSSQSGTHKDEKDRYGKKTLTIVPVERRRATSAKASAGGTSEEMEKTTDETTTEANAKRKSTGATPLLVVNLEKGTVKMAKNRKKDKAKLQGVLATAVKRSEVKLTDMGSAKIGPLDEDDCMDATNLVMDLFFKVRPQDFLARKRLAKAQSDRVYAGLLDGVQNATDRVLIAAKVGSNLVGIAEVSLPNGDRFGAESYRPKAPADKPYLSDVAVAKTQRGRGIGKALVLAAEETMREMGETVMYTHTKVDNEGAQKLFEKCGYSEPDWAKKGLTQAQIAQRSTEWNPFAAVGLVEVGHFMLEKPLAP